MYVAYVIWKTFRRLGDDGIVLYIGPTLPYVYSAVGYESIWIVPGTLDVTA